MSDETLTPERILDMAEEVLRRFGPAKTTVVDVARALGVSHGSVYRHFPSKAALRDEVTARWLARVLEPLTGIVSEDGSASERLWRWLTQLSQEKRKRATDDPELFATYMALVAEAREVTKAHLEHMTEQISQIIADGIARGEFVTTDPIITGRAILDATTRFHNPIHVPEWSNPDIDTEFERVWSLILAGLRSRPTSR